MKLIQSLIPCIAAAALAFPTGASAADLTPYRVGFNNWIGFIAFFVAQEKGMFKEAGLDVQAKAFSAPGEGLVPLLSGDLDAHLTTLDAVVLKSAQSPDKFKVVGLIDTSAGADALVGSSAVKTLADLKGRKVAVTLGECNHVLLIKALQSAGLTEKDITIANMDPDAAGAALKAGSVDAAVTWEPWITQLSGESGANVLYSTKDAPNILLDCVAVTTKPSNAEATKTFLSVLDAATKLVKADPKAAAELVAAKLELPASDIQDMLTKVTLYDSAESKAAMTSSIPAIAKELSDFFLSQGSTTRDVPAEEILSVDFIQ